MVYIHTPDVPLRLMKLQEAPPKECIYHYLFHKCDLLFVLSLAKVKTNLKYSNKKGTFLLKKYIKYQFLCCWLYSFFFLCFVQTLAFTIDKSLFLAKEDLSSAWPFL